MCPDQLITAHVTHALDEEPVLQDGVTFVPVSVIDCAVLGRVTRPVPRTLVLVVVGSTKLVDARIYRAFIVGQEPVGYCRYGSELAEGAQGVKRHFLVLIPEGLDPLGVANVSPQREEVSFFCCISSVDEARHDCPDAKPGH